MRRYLLAATAAGLLSVAAPAAGGAIGDRAEPAVAVAVAVAAPPPAPLKLRDEALMVLVGSALIGLAAAVRRSA